MQEIALILSSIAGVATAAAVRKMPRDKNQLLSLGASSHIKNQINSLKIEKDILTKTISRLYQSDDEFSKIQKDKLLLKYQHQLGTILAKLEKLEQASKHPDLGPLSRMAFSQAATSTVSASVPRDVTPSRQHQRRPTAFM